MVAAQRLAHGLAEFLAQAQLQRIFSGGRRGKVQEARGAGIVRQHAAGGVQHQKALLHVFGDRFELLLLALKLLHLAFDLPLLVGQAAQQRRQLFVGGLAWLGMLQVDFV